MTEKTKINCTISLKSGIGINWCDYFNNIEIVEDRDTIVLKAMLEDQAALHGMLAMIRNLNIEIKSMNCEECDN